MEKIDHRQGSAINGNWHVFLELEGNIDIDVSKRFCVPMKFSSDEIDAINREIGDTYAFQASHCRI